MRLMVSIHSNRFPSVISRPRPLLSLSIPASLLRFDPPLPSSLCKIMHTFRYSTFILQLISF